MEYSKIANFPCDVVDVGGAVFPLDADKDHQPIVNLSDD